MTKAEGPRAITIGRLSGPAPDRTASARPFAALAARYLACGITPFPVTGKEPAVKGYMRQFSQATIAEWAKRMPGCNLGLSTSLHGLIVLDARRCGRRIAYSRHRGADAAGGSHEARLPFLFPRS